MRKIAFIVAAALVFTALPSCHNNHDHDHQHHDEEHDHHHHDDHGHDHHHHDNNVVLFTDHQARRVGLQVEEVHPIAFGQVIRTTAQVLPSQGDEREATASAAGVVVFARPDLVEGTAVTAGQKLFEIQSNGMADNNMSVRLQEAAANYNVAKSEYERKQALVADKIVSQSEVDRARANYESAKAVYNNLQTNFSPNGSVVRAPISGYVKSLNVRNGGYVEAGRSVITVAQNRDMQLRAEVPPRYYSCLRDIKTVNLQAPGIDSVQSLTDLHGNLISFGKATGSDSPMIPVTFRVRNTGRLLSGSFVNLYITTTADRHTLTVPNSSIVEEMGNYFVFVKVHDEEYEKRLVTLGATDGLRTEVTSGITEGESVVSRGSMMVKLAQGTGALDPHAGHVH